ncbi:MULTISPECIES: Gfo/Idh/MocA family protein [unclassified Streptomyces]|uniref:Gfo/Idh/MocA family protein n=1 Tax=unclassified Streptomyces TaxID=2593676 RepID=UPI0007492E34|nr:MULTISPECIES: Gfo/Idh/MocA family oxidoreductase [unclassified Streptomyces]KUL54164.1 oxidoreductase [Streptomyces sp. NRRL S-1521]THC55356.1 Gfo/Idh/MocA family oxidoreductase [Streptomyces sp. A1499]
MNRLRIGLVGTGPWATATHAPALAKHSDIDFSGVWGRRPEAAATLAAAHGTSVHEDVDQLFAASDAVAFAVPPDVQAPLAERAAAAGCHLLLDKPVATTPEAGRRLAQAAERAHVASVVFFTLRFADVTSAWLDEQRAMDGWYTGRADWYGSFYTPEGNTLFSSPWRESRGGLWDVGPHALSMLLPVLGDVSEVAAARGPGDTVHLILRHTSGASSTAALSLTAPEKGTGLTVELRGENGVFVMPPWERSDEAIGNAIDALLSAVRTGTPDPCDVRFGLRVTEILAQAEERIATT